MKKQFTICKHGELVFSCPICKYSIKESREELLLEKFEDD